MPGTVKSFIRPLGGLTSTTQRRLSRRWTSHTSQSCRVPYTSSINFLSTCHANPRAAMSFNASLVAGDESRAPKPGVELRADSGLTYKIERVLKEDPKILAYVCHAM